MNDALLRLFGRPGQIETAGVWLKAQLNNTAWIELRAAVAFAKSSGVQHIQADLRNFATRPNTDTQITVGIDLGGTSLEAMQDLWRLLDGYGSLFTMHQKPTKGQRPTFHPKLYQFRNQNSTALLIGSANLTEGGLFTNYESSIAVQIDNADASSQELIGTVEAMLDACQTAGPTCKKVDEDVLQSLYKSGLLPSEAEIELVGSATRAARRATRKGQTPLPPLFGSGEVAPVPPRQHVPGGLPPRPVEPAKPSGALIVKPAEQPTEGPSSAHSSLYMEVVPHHNGEVFLSYLAAREDPGFFQWPFNGLTTPHRLDNPPYPTRDPDPIVNIRIYGHDGNVEKQRLKHSLNVVDYERNHEIRITLPEGLHEVPARSLLIMTRDPEPGVEYELAFHPPGTAAISTAETYLTKKMPSGGKPQPRRYGWA